MATVPVKLNDRITFYETRAEGWVTEAENIGTTAAKASAVASAAVAARAAFNAAEQARQDAKNATVELQTALLALDAAGATVIRDVRDYAIFTEDENVYAIADLPPRKQPAPRNPPGVPYKLAVSLLGDGTLRLGWKCDNPAGATGTTYTIERAVGEGPFAYIGTAGEREYDDTTLPAGAGAGAGGLIRYQITGVRGKTSGDPARFEVSIGKAGTTTAGEGLKIAA